MADQTVTLLIIITACAALISLLASHVLILRVNRDIERALDLLSRQFHVEPRSPDPAAPLIDPTRVASHHIQFNVPHRTGDD